MRGIASAAGLSGISGAVLFNLCNLALEAPAAAQAVQQDSEIIVTARRRAERPQRVPISLSIVDGKTIEAHDLRNSTDLTARAPNLLAPANAVAISAPTFYIRGVGAGDRNWNDENAVAEFVDDVYVQSTAGLWIDFADMDRVEVLRGPQGTLYGRNSTSGAIKFVPRLPDPSNVTAYGDALVGAGGRVDIKTGFNLPIARSTGAIRLNVYDVRNNGNLTEVDTANRSIDDRLGRTHHSGARLATLWRPRPGLEFELNGDIEHQDDGMFVVSPILPDEPGGITDFHAYFSRLGTQRFVPLYGPGRAALEPLTEGGNSVLTGGGVVFKARLDTSLGRLSSIAAWRGYHMHFNSQLGGRSTPSTFFGASLYGNADTVYERPWQFSEELQLSGKRRSVDYTFGAYFFHDRWRESEYGATNGIPANLSPYLFPGQTRPFGGSFNDIDQTTNSYALYGSLDWHVTPKVTVSAGARETWDHKDLFYNTLFEDHVHEYPGFPLNTAKSWRRFTPRLGVDWKPSPGLMLYASWAKGYKVGNVEGARSTDPVAASHWLAPELATTWEAGVKADAFGHRLQLDLDAFASLNTGRTDIISPDLVASSNVRSRGIEAEATLQPTAGLKLHGSAGLLWTKYRDLSPNHPAFIPDPTDPTGPVPGYSAQPPMSPRYTLSADATYRARLGTHGSVTGNASVYAVARHFHPLGIFNFDSEIVAPYAVVDAGVGWESANERIRVTIGAHNLLDKLYWTTGMFGSIPEFAGRYYADRRRLYLELRYAR